MGRVKLLIAIAQFQKPVIVIVIAFEPNTLNIFISIPLSELISVSFVYILLTETKKKRKAK